MRCAVTSGGGVGAWGAWRRVGRMEARGSAAAAHERAEGMPLLSLPPPGRAAASALGGRLKLATLPPEGPGRLGLPLPYLAVSESEGSTEELAIAPNASWQKLEDAAHTLQARCCALRARKRRAAAPQSRARSPAAETAKTRRYGDR